MDYYVLGIHAKSLTLPAFSLTSIIMRMWKFCNGVSWILARNVENSIFKNSYSSFGWLFGTLLFIWLNELDVRFLIGKLYLFLGRMIALLKLVACRMVTFLSFLVHGLKTQGLWLLHYWVTALLLWLLHNWLTALFFGHLGLYLMIFVWIRIFFILFFFLLLFLIKSVLLILIIFRKCKWFFFLLHHLLFILIIFRNCKWFLSCHS